MPKPKHNFDTMPRRELPADAARALITFRNDLSASMKPGAAPLSKSKYDVFGNNRTKENLPNNPLPKPEDGCEYREIQVGESRELDEDGKPKRGKRRLVVELNKKSRQPKEYYFTEDHYFGFYRLVPPPKT